MSTWLLDHIGELVTNDASAGDGPLGRLADAALLVEDDTVAWVGPSRAAPAADARVDAGGRAVVPGFVDSHTHLVFAGDRAQEFAARMAGRPYAAGGIRTTVAATRAATAAALAGNAARLAAEALASGTTTLEAKSGYGLTVADEARSLAALDGLPALAGPGGQERTFLGAHVPAPEYEGRADDYVRLVTGPMLDACAPHARWVDAFCERGAFDADQCREVLTAGARRGLGMRLHGNQLGAGPGVRLAVELGAASVDHATHLADADVDALAGSATVATLLPAAEFSTRGPWPDARRLLDAGVPVALASDCNPGTSYTTSLPFCVALAVREMGMTPDEALWAATAGGARALRRDDVGHLGVGGRADAVLLAAPSSLHLAYRPGVALVEAVWRAGRLVAGTAPAA